MLTLLTLLALSQTNPAVRRSTPLSDDPGMVVRQAGTVPVACTNCGNIFLPDGGNIGIVTQGRGLDGGTGWGVFIEGGNLSVSAGISFDGGSIGYLRMPDGGALEVYTVNAGSSGGGWVPDGGYIGLVTAKQGIGPDGGPGWIVHGDEIIGNLIVDGDDALATQSVIVGHTTAGGGSYVDVKVTPSGALVSEVTQASFPWLIAAMDGGIALPVYLFDGGGVFITNATMPTTPVTGTFWQATQPVSGPLTDAQLRATPVPVSGTVATDGLTDAQLRATPVVVAGDGGVTAYQGGTWNVTNVSGTISLPTGASTSALQTSGNSSLSSIDTKTPSLGQAVMASSSPVVIASNQSAVPVTLTSTTITGTVAVTESGTWSVRNQDGAGNSLASSTTTPAGTEQALIVRNIPSGTQPVSGTVAATQSGTWNVTNVSGTVSLPTGAATETTLGTRLAESTFTGRFPAAGALADATANPTTTGSAVYLMGYNGTTWDRIRSSTSLGITVNISNTTLAVTQSGTWNVGLSAGTNYVGKTRITDGTLDVSLLNSAPGADTGQVSVPVRVISSLAGGAGGTSSTYGAAFPATGTASGFSDGTNMQGARVFDADTGAGSQYVVGTNLRVSASGGSTEAAAGAGATNASTLRVVLPTDQTVIPVSDNGGSLTVDGTVAVSGTVTVSGTVDTEMPAAGALADATANPTTTTVGTALLGYNGTTWDRLRSTIAGGLLVNVSNASIPVTQSGTWNLTNISGTVSLPTGAATETTLGTRLAESTFTGRFSAGAAATDNFANPTTTGTLGFNMLWDGATWDRAPGTSVDGTLVNLGANNDVTVTSGSITANAGTNLNTSALLLDATFTGRLPAAAATADNFANPTTSNAMAMNMVWDGATWDRMPGTSALGVTMNLGSVGGTGVTLGQKAMTASFPVVLASDQSAVTVTGTVAATQSGTWTVQPGNTANTTAWLTNEGSVSSANNAGGCTSVTASTTVLASNASRRSAVITASSANTAIIYVKLGATATSANYPLDPGASIKLDARTYTGVVDAIAASGTQSACAIELN